ncbi:MAG: glycosyltransferase [Deltaproteobacteria bacterium]|nr:glycosyltransferase [Deltaproteobacteria bacterium]
MESPLSSLKVALVHDWLVTYRGGEKVLEGLCRLFPSAPIHTLLHEKGSQPLSIERHTIIESPLAKIPGARKRHRLLLPLYPWAIEQFDLSAYDLVVSTSHAVAKGVITRADAVHVCYVHTPMRYVWELTGDYMRGMSRPVRAAVSIVAPLLRLWDESSERRVDHFVANSRTVARRIHKRYRRDAHVIYPPVDVDRFAPAAVTPLDKDAPYLVVSALVPYKRIDLVIDAFKTGSRKLVIIGDGPERERLEREAGPNVRFLGYQTSAQLAEHYRNAQALLFPGEEDFGITPVEAMAAGRPVIAFARGGATESVVPLGHVKGEGKAPTGVWFDAQTTPALLQAIERFEASREKFLPASISEHARRFHGERFLGEMKSLLEGVWQSFSHAGPTGDVASLTQARHRR